MHPGEEQPCETALPPPVKGGGCGGMGTQARTLLFAALEPGTGAVSPEAQSLRMGIGLGEWCRGGSAPAAGSTGPEAIPLRSHASGPVVFAICHSSPRGKNTNWEIFLREYSMHKFL